jgi:quercetin dioxygenase-like cupin family protein
MNSARLKHSMVAMLAMLAILMVAPGVALAQSASLEQITPAFHAAIPNIPGKSVSAVVVAYQPGGKSPSHRHARSAFVVGYVLSGAIRSQLDGGEVKVFRPGESWVEPPGTYHTISDNASATEPASLLAIFIADSSETELTTFDPR